MRTMAFAGMMLAICTCVNAYEIETHGCLANRVVRKTRRQEGFFVYVVRLADFPSRALIAS